MNPLDPVFMIFLFLAPVTALVVLLLPAVPLLLFLWFLFNIGPGNRRIGGYYLITQGKVAPHLGK